MAKRRAPVKRDIAWRRRLAGLGVHALTATGAATGFLALVAAVEGSFTLMFVWLAVALAVDAVDGTLARRADIGRTAPEFSGDVLDLVVDYVTWVFVPALALYRAGLLPGGLALPLVIAILLTSALYFADVRMKTEDRYFRGFPGAWNVFAFVVFVFRPDPWIAAACVVALCVLTFVPVAFVHPMRVARFRTANLAILGLTTVLVGLALWWQLDPPPAVKAGLAAAAAYFLGVGLLRGKPLR